VHLRAPVICVLATALTLACPAAALADISQGDPTSSYARTPDCSGTNRMPVEVVLDEFPSPASAESQIDMQIAAHEAPWADFAGDTKMLNMDGPGGVHCEDQITGRVVTSTDGDFRTILRLWSYTGGGGPLAGAAAGQHRVTGIPGCGWATNSGGGGGPGGFTAGRKRFEQAFQGATPTNGPYPLKEYDWGNTAEFQVCDSNNTVASDGNVAVIRPKDNFGYNDRWRLFAPNADPAQDPFQLAEDQGVTVARYAANWNLVGANGSITTGACSQRPGSWNALDNAYENLTGHMACTDLPTPDPPATPIRPLIYVRNAPSPYARWWDALAGTCTSTEDPSTSDDPITGVVADNATANTAWQGFVQNVADRYQRAIGIEIWNEPNLKKYWGNCARQPARYAEVLQLANEGITASSHPNIPIVLGGMAPLENPPSPEPPDPNAWRTYLDDVFDAPGLQDPVSTLFDVMSIHPYRNDQDVDVGRWFPGAAELDVTQARTFLTNHNAASKPVWVTEVGATTAGSDVNPGPKHVVDEDQQARVLRDVYQKLRNDARVPVVIIHRFSDSNTGEEPAGYGVVRIPDLLFAKKAAYRCLKLTRGRAGICPS
jgi:hypothetical protein